MTQDYGKITHIESALLMFLLCSYQNNLTEPDQVYPCCGHQVFGFDPFEIPTVSAWVAQPNTQVHELKRIAFPPMCMLSACIDEFKICYLHWGQLHLVTIDNVLNMYKDSLGFIQAYDSEKTVMQVKWLISISSTLFWWYSNIVITV